MKPPAKLVAELATAFGLRASQVRAIARLGAVNWRDRNTALRTIRAVKMTLREAAAIWGFRGGRMLRKHAASGKLKVASDGMASRVNPQLVTIRGMLDLMEELDHPGFGLRP